MKVGKPREGGRFGDGGKTRDSCRFVRPFVEIRDFPDVLQMVGHSRPLVKKMSNPPVFIF